LLAFIVLDQLRHICLDQNCRSNLVNLFFDSRTLLRRAIFPSYKTKRLMTKHGELQDKLTLRNQMDELRRKYLEYLGIPCFEEQGYEADDLIASATASTPLMDNHVIVTADQDLWQCVGSKTIWFNPTSGRRVDMRTFHQQYDINPWQWADVKELAGCHGDDVRGIEGVGEKTAVKYLTGKLKSKAKLTAIDSAKSCKVFMDRQSQLVRLPYPGTPSIKPRIPGWDREKFRILSFAMPGLLAGLGAIEWQTILSGHFSIADRQRKRKRGVA